MNVCSFIIFVLAIVFPGGCSSSDRSADTVPPRSSSYRGLVMAGYQGWFNADGDGAGRGWFHYQKEGRFEPGYCTIDLWPETGEYSKIYETEFRYNDGSPAFLFSSYDETTTDLHFKWMKEYGIDGVFMQRFVSTIKNPAGFAHYERILESSFRAAEKYERIICIMYDLSGMEAVDYQKVIDDWKYLVTKFNLLNHRPSTYLTYNGKPLVAVWGIGFNNKRNYGLEEAEKIVRFLKDDPVYGGVAVQVGVPSRWRELTGDAVNDSKLHQIISISDIVHPWFVGRYRSEAEYDSFRGLIIKDLSWCSQRGVGYVPTVFPGFSWKNLYSDSETDMIPRREGNFYWAQLYGAIEAGAEMIYVAMFDEIDEGTAIFKCAHEVPVVTPEQVADGGILNVFVPIEKSVDTDYYMWLTGQAARMLRKEIKPTKDKPLRITN